MNVSELIEKLKAAPPDLEVSTEGCDCYGDVALVIVMGDAVMLCRSDGDFAVDHAPYVKL